MAEVSNISYYPAPVSRKRKIGATIAGALIGMNAYYIPVKKDIFVQKAFDVTKNEANMQIAALTKAAKEVESKNVSTESKMILQEMGLSENFKDITDKCIEIDKKVSDPSNVQKLKAIFDKNFKNYKKQPALMDNNCAAAYKAIRKNKFWWGTGIGAATGLALGLMSGRE